MAGRKKYAPTERDKGRVEALAQAEAQATANCSMNYQHLQRPCIKVSASTAGERGDADAPRRDHGVVRLALTPNTKIRVLGVRHLLAGLGDLDDVIDYFGGSGSTSDEIEAGDG
jgi:hypothetical protein